MSQHIQAHKVIIPPERQRTEHDIEAHQELVESIIKHGLFHAIVLRNGDTLVAGERRIRAMKDIIELGGSIIYDGETYADGFIPYVELGSLSPLAAEEAELEENIRRTDLSWQDRARATARLEVLRKTQAELGLREPQTRREFALEVRGGDNANDQTEVRNDVILARHLSRPEVAKAKTAKEALKVLKNIERQERNEELALSIGKTISSHSHKLLLEDSLVWLGKAEAAQFDIILTDPPYGMGADEFGDSGGAAAGAHGYMDDAEYFRKIMGTFIPESFRVCKEQAHLYCFCDIDKFAWLREAFAYVGWKVFRTPLIWYKPNGQRAPWPDKGPQRKYETILFAVKGDKLVTKLMGDVLVHPTEENLGHAAQKPVALYRDLLARSAVPGSRVLDPFGGTGPLLPAAHDLKCYATVIERDPASYGIAATRLKGLV